MWVWVGVIVLIVIMAIGYGFWGKDNGDLPSEVNEPAPDKQVNTKTGAWINSTNPAILAAGRHLMVEIQSEANDITLSGATPFDWPDGCLGVPQGDELCTQAIVPGYEILFFARGVEFVYHTNLDGTSLRLRTPFDAKG